MKRPRPVGNPLTAFLQGPRTARHAIRALVVFTIITTVLGGLLVWTFDHEDFGSIGSAMWWSLQTVTTVGYGDVVPRNPVGRIIGALVLLYAVAFLSILTAAITTSLVEEARRERQPQAGPELSDVVDRLDAVLERLDRLEQRDDAHG